MCHLIAVNIKQLGYTFKQLLIRYSAFNLYLIKQHHHTMYGGPGFSHALMSYSYMIGSCCVWKALSLREMSNQIRKRGPVKLYLMELNISHANKCGQHIHQQQTHVTAPLYAFQNTSTEGTSSRWPQQVKQWLNVTFSVQRKESQILLSFHYCPFAKFISKAYALSILAFEWRNEWFFRHKSEVFQNTHEKEQLAEVVWEIPDKECYPWNMGWSTDHMFWKCSTGMAK